MAQTKIIYFLKKIYERTADVADLRQQNGSKETFPDSTGGITHWKKWSFKKSADPQGVFVGARQNGCFISENKTP